MNRYTAYMPTQSRVNACLIFSSDLPVNYILNPKGGCSTILAHLWKSLDDATGQKTFTGNPHDAWPWGRVFENSVQKIAHISAKRTFTMVRNPFARVLSAYLSKVGERTPANLFTWDVFRGRFKLAADAQLSFDEFLDLIAREPIEMMDMHWAPQIVNLMQPAARIDRLFYTERSDDLGDFLEEWTGRPLELLNRGDRNAVEHLSHYYTDRSIALARRIYAADFETFGYSDDYRIQESVRPIDALPGSPGGITPLLKHMASTDWQEKLVLLDRFEHQSGADFATAMSRFCCGGPEDERLAAAEKVLNDRPENWLLLREIENIFRAHGDKANAARFGKASRKAHAAILRRPRQRKSGAAVRSRSVTPAAASGRLQAPPDMI